MWILLGFALGAGSLFALDPSTSLSQYQKAEWRTENGLPQNFVNALLQDADGSLLIGLEGGFTRFDGLRFSPVDFKTEYRLSQEWITVLHRSNDGALWIGTRDQGLFRSAAGRMDHFTPQNGLADRDVRSLYEDREGDLWIGASGGLSVYRRGRMETVEGRSGVGGYRWCSFAQDGPESFWFVNDEGLLHFGPGGWTLAAGRDTPLGEPLAIYRDASRRLWLGTTKGLYESHGGGEPKWSRIDGVDGSVSNLLADRSGNLWVATWGHGLYRWNQRGVQHWSMRDGLSDDFVRVIHEDREGNLWIGTRSGGLSRWKQTALEPYGVPEGLHGPFASAVTAALDGSMWLGTWRSGLYRFAGEKLISVPVPGPEVNILIRALGADKQGRIWISTWTGFYSLQNGRYTNYSEIVQPGPTVIMSARDGSLWVGTERRGLLRFRDGVPRPASQETLLVGQSITTLFEASDGTVWAGTPEGAAHIAGGRTAFLKAGEELPRGAVATFFEDAHKRVWIASKGARLTILDAGRSVDLGSAPGMPRVNILRILPDDNRHVWLSSPRGIWRLSADEVDSWLAGTLSRVDPMPFNEQDGMRSIECHGWSQMPGGRSRDGTLWFPTVRGFVRVRPDRVRPLSAPDVTLDQVLLNGSAITANGRNSVQLAAGARDLEIRFNAIRLSSPGRIRFRYQLKGFDTEWIDSDGERFARYTSLPPGRYEFAAMAGAAGSDWGPPAVLASIDQQPGWTETVWFPVFLIVAAGAAASLLWRWRELQLRARQRAVHAERTRIAREWHDTLLADFAAIAWQLEATSGALHRNPDLASAPLGLARSMVRHSQSEARRIIWDLREDSDTHLTLREALDHSLRTLAGANGVESRLHVSGDENGVPPQTRRHVLRVCQEAIANAVRHGRPSRVEVAIEVDGTQIRACVEDDGCGFDRQTAGAKPGHFGLLGIEDRVRQLGGKMRIQSAQGCGTTLEVTVPFVQANS
jgi:signal transduction histidine kinase/ligand-binding sensor domain-containing protein